MRWAGLAWVMLAASCGRIGFQVAADTDAPLGTTDGAGVAITRVGTFVATGHSAAAASDMFTAAAAHAGDAIVLNVYCTSNTPVTSVAIDSSGVWVWSAISGLVSAVADTDYGASYAAIAPDTNTGTFMVSWAGTGQCDFVEELGDEFANADPTGGATTFDAHAEAFGSNGDCITALTAGHANDAVWAACSGLVTATGVGYTKGGDDGQNDWSEYRVTQDPSGTPETPSFTNSTTSWLMTAVSIKPRD